VTVTSFWSQRGADVEYGSRLIGLRDPTSRQEFPQKLKEPALSASGKKGQNSAATVMRPALQQCPQKPPNALNACQQ